MQKFLYQTHRARVIITGPSEDGNSCFLTKLILNIINDFAKLYFYSLSLPQDLYHKSINCFCNNMPINTIQHILNEKDLEFFIKEIFKDEIFEKSETEIETFE